MKTRKFIIAASLTFAFLVVGFVIVLRLWLTLPDTRPFWTAYRDEEFRFVMACPDAKGVDRRPNGVSCTGSYGLTLASVSVISSDVKTLEEWFERDVDTFVPLQLSSEESALGGLRALALNTPSGDQSGKSYYVQRDDAVIIVTTYLPPDLRAEFLDRFRFLDDFGYPLNK
jgi:hypothetical protein